MIANYFDLTIDEPDIDQIKIIPDTAFNCRIVTLDEKSTYTGFILAKTPKGNIMTVCDVDFQLSGTDHKYQPRLVFRKVDVDFADKKVKAGSASIRIPFQTGGEGYRQFWKMIFFLSSYKHLVDTGDFASNYKVSSGTDITDYLNTNDDYEQLARDLQNLDIKSSSDLNSITTLKLLREIRTKLEGFILTNASEKEVQAWIDEDEHSHRQRRCLMFGLEYINFNREGSASSKKFDILTRIGNKNIEHVLIELKSPSESIFKLKQTGTINSPTIEYSLHEDVSRSVPQILEYKRLLESKPAGDPDLEKIGIKTTVHIKKCIIIIGKNNDDPRWIQNKNSVLDALNSSLEIWTYTDLLNKLDSTISNLEAAAS